MIQTEIDIVFSKVSKIADPSAIVAETLQIRGDGEFLDRTSWALAAWKVNQTRSWVEAL